MHISSAGDLWLITLSQQLFKWDMRSQLDEFDRSWSDMGLNNTYEVAEFNGQVYALSEPKKG